MSNRTRSNEIEFIRPIEEWAKGVAQFNEARFWEAHEAWEKEWGRLPEPEKTYIQGLIQVAAALHLSQRGRWEPARRLCVLAREKLEHTHERIQGVLPRIEIPGATKELVRVVEERSCGAFDLRLKAELLLPPAL